MKNILIAGAGGYIGSRMTELFLEKGYYVTALDRFFFGENLTDLKENEKLKIVKNDIRFLKKEDLKNIDIVINLASISNDPAADLDPKITNSINYKGALKLAKVAKQAKVKKYIFSSSCSVYGAGDDYLKETSELAPISEYARSKIKAEKELLKIADKNFSVTILRLATVFGISKRRMRFDLLINILTLHSWKNKKIFILGGGKQWRPLIHIDDCINAFYKAALSKKSYNKEIFNIGSNKLNFQVITVANKFRKYFPDLSIEEAPDDPDPRNYKIDFSKAKKVLNFTTKKTIDDGIKEIKDALEKGEITDSLNTNTLRYYQYLMDTNNILSRVKIKNRLF